MKAKSVVALSLILASGLGIGATAQQASVKPWRLDYSGYLNRVSRNGCWATAQPRSGEMYDKTQIIDVMQGKVVNLPVEKIVYASGVSGDPVYGANVVTSAVSEDGKIVGGTYGEAPAYWKDNTWTYLPFPNKKGQYFNGYTSAVVTNIRCNGKYMIGYAYNQAFDVKPMLWIDGELAIPENLPTRDWKGNWVVEHVNNDGDRVAPEGNMTFCDISEDGRYLLGGMSTNHPGWGCCYFIYDMQKNTYEILGLSELNELIASGEYFEQTEVMGDVPLTMSADGKYVVGNVNLVKNNGTEWPTELKYPFVYSIEDNEMTILDNPANENIGCNGITDNGELVGMSSLTSPARSVVFLKDGVWYTLESILEQVYNINYNAVTGYSDLTGTPFGISSDGHTVVCMTPGSDATCYMVDLSDETFYDAAKKVNMLKNCEPFPANNAEIVYLDNMMVRFERGVEYNNKKATITNSKGEVVATSTDVIRPASVSDARYMQINFPKTKFEKGEVYNMNIPEGMFRMQNSDVVSMPMTFTYKGREEKAVMPVSIAPANESPVRELGVNSMISMTFGCPIQTSSTAGGALYQEGNDTPLSSLNITYSGNTVYAYPTMTRFLKKGTKYIVKINEGSIVDLTGYCPSLEIKLKYDGSYEKFVDGDILFEDDFNENGTSLATWMMYEGDHNSPLASLVTAFEFDADNTPWNFSIRDEGNYDYAAAAHSMFTSPGKADDWMVTPQMTVPNKYYYLDFDAQSYRKNKKDKLKVIAWVNDEIVGDVDKNFIDKMRAEGVVLVDDVQSPGLNEENLEGEWKHYHISLQDFSGKSIYIAFVNENEDQSMVFVDNVKVEFKGNYSVGIDDDPYIVGMDSHEVTAFVSVLNDNEVYNAITATLSNADNSFTSTYTASGLNLKKGDSYHFTFPEVMPLKKAETNKFNVKVVMGEESQTVSGVFHNLAFEPVHRVVLEEGTGTWCGNCPRGILAIEDLEKKFGDNFIPVSVHNNDPMADENYISFLGFNAFPMGRVNRQEVFLAPTVVDPKTGLQSFVSESGEETFHDYVMKELNTPALAEINITKGTRNEAGNIVMEAEVKFALAQEDVYYNVLAVLLEDNIPGLQSSYISGNSDPLYGEWGLGGKYDAGHPLIDFMDVARAVGGGSYYGASGFIPGKVEVDTPYKATLKFNMPASVIEPTNTKLVAMIVDAQSGRIINADRIKSLEVVGVDSMTATEQGAEFKVNNGTIMLNGSATGVTVFTFDGRMVANNNLKAGMYIARGVAGNKMATAKILVK